MKTIEDQVDDLLEERPQDVHEDPGVPPLRVPDDEDLEEIVEDAYNLLSDLLDRPMPKGLKERLVELHGRLEEITGWSTFH
jgi:hypothetical protein